jgi:hypothetical protein
MLIFIFSFLATVIVSLCFFKSKFWENRYLILLIGSGVALVATLTTNYFVRGHFEKKIETVWNSPLYTFYMPDSILFKYGFQHMDSLCPEQVKMKFINNYSWYEKHSGSEFWKDSTKKQTPVHFVLYAMDKKGKARYIGIFRSKYKQGYYDFDLIYIAPSSADTLAYIVKKKLVYNVLPNNWLTGFSFPIIKTAKILYLPPKEYALIPDSLIRKLPF